MSEEKDNPQWEEKEYEADGPNLRYDDFVGRIVTDPKEPPCVTLLSGYLGSSSEEGHVRLYLDEELCRYVEIPEKAIRHTQELSPEQSPLGGSLVWIDQDAEVLHGAAGSERRKATFLEGQIAQDYIGGVGSSNVPGGVGGALTTQTRECKGILPTDMGPGCWQTQYVTCLKQTESPHCFSLTGISCTRFGPNCHTVLLQQCQSVYNLCVTQNQSYCQVTGGVPCNPPIDFTIYEHGGVQQQFAGGVAQRQAVGGGGFDPNTGVFQTGFNCPSVFDNCATRESFCPTQSFSCPSRLVICNQSQFNRCVTRTPIECGVTRFNCPSRDIPCPTRAEPRCFASRTFICPDTVAGCQFDTAVCGVDPAGGGAQAFRAEAFHLKPTAQPICPEHPTASPHCPLHPTASPHCPLHPTASPHCPEHPTASPHCPGFAGAAGVGAVGAVPQTQFCVSRAIRCQSAVDLCPSRVCPSVYSPCVSQLTRCPSALDACPTRFNCPTLPNGCPGNTRFGACETFGPCPSAVDACPTRFGCFETQVCGGGESIACFPGGGFDPGGFGGGGF
jgi:hypothetical protein